MPEPMTKMEIEDVLSSIRRLVSEDGVHKPKVVRPDVKPVPQFSRPECLVLTPAFMVVPAAVPKAKSAEDAAVGDTVSAEAAEAGAVQADSTEPNAEIVFERSWKRPDAEKASNAAVEKAPIAEPEDVSVGDRRSLEERIAELEATIGDSDEEFEPDGSEEQVSFIPTSILRAVTSDGVELPLPEAAEPLILRSSAPEATDDRPYADVETVENPEWTFAPEPDDAVVYGEVEEQAEAPEAAANPAEEKHAAPVETQFEEAFIDEDSLREIVGEFVRDELRGELGERITRNVRRLIRKELERALALKSLEEE